jgi:hypothetical protein
VLEHAWIVCLLEIGGTWFVGSGLDGLWRYSTGCGWLVKDTARVVGSVYAFVIQVYFIGMWLAGYKYGVGDQLGVCFRGPGVFHRDVVGWLNIRRGGWLGVCFRGM